MAEVLNANPTIRNASDLPSRRRQGPDQPSSNKPKGLFSGTVPPSAYLPDPFSPSSSSDSELSDNDDAEVEPIDEQEIYGTPQTLFSQLYLDDVLGVIGSIAKLRVLHFMHAELTASAQTSFPPFQTQNIPSLWAHSPSSIFRIFSLPQLFRRGANRHPLLRLLFSSPLL